MVITLADKTTKNDRPKKRCWAHLSNCYNLQKSIGSNHCSTSKMFVCTIVSGGLCLSLTNGPFVGERPVAEWASY